MRKFTLDGELLLTLGRSDEEGKPFRLPTDVGFDSRGDMYISDGYGNTRTHKYTPDGAWINSWGEPGDGSGEFDLPHCVRVDRNDRVLVADRANNRTQIFDTEGTYLTEWAGLYHLETILIDEDDIVYIAELDHRVSTWTLEGERLAEWGGVASSEMLGEFLGRPPGIWTDSHGGLYVGEVHADGRVQQFVRQR